MSKWIEAKLADICLQEKGAIISGPFGSNISSKYFVSEGVPVIRGNNLSLDLDKFYDDGFVFVTEQKAEELNCYAIEGDLLFTAAGTIGQVGILQAPLKYKQYVISNKQMRARIDTSKVGLLYAYYWYSSPWMQNYFIRNNKGSTVPLITLSELKEAPIRYPESIQEQQAIVEAIERISKKIDLNREICGELESMAKTLYDYWFVQFDFPDANGKPYRASGGERVWNEQLKCEIPKGWVVRPLSYYLYCNRNTIKRNEWNSYINYLDTGSLTSNRIDELQRYETIEEAPSRAQRVVCPNDILYSTVRPNQCHYGLIKSPSPNLVASSGFACLASKFSAEYNDLFYLFLTSERIVNRLTSIAASSVSAYPSINPSDILEQFIALPEELDSIHGLSNRLCDLLSAVTHYQTESKELTRLRDWLLPMLMNGQATVAPAESAPKLQVLRTEKSVRDPHFDRWLQTQGVAARGTVDEQTLHDIFDAMDDDDKQ